MPIKRRGTTAPKKPSPPPPPKYRNRGPAANLTRTSGMFPGATGYGLTGSRNSSDPEHLSPYEQQRLAAWTELGYMNRAKGITTSGKSTVATRGYRSKQQIKEGWERMAGVQTLPNPKKPGTRVQHDTTENQRGGGRGKGQPRRPSGTVPQPRMDTSPGTRTKQPKGGVASTSRPAAPKRPATPRRSISAGRRKAL